MKSSNKTKRFLLRLGLILLLYPMLELVTPLRISGGISRESLTSTFEPLNLENFTEGVFQETLSDYVSDQIGFFAFFVKLHNQLEYSLFGNIFTGEVVKGKDNYLFEQPYIDTYFGKDFLGLPKIERFGGVFKELQDSLEARGKVVVFGMATGKASFYPEYLPYQEEVDSLNYDYFRQEFDKRGINYIDFIPYFQELKKEYGDLLFPKYGIHWSHFSNVFVADTLVRFIEGKTGWDLPNVHITKMNYSTEPRYYDNDIASSMNLFTELKPDSMAYPDFEWDPKTADNPKKLLIIGDSFGWDLVENLRLGQDCFDEMEFWYYNLTVHTTDSRLNRRDNLPYLIRHKDLHQVLDEYDAFFIVSNEPNVYFRGWRFPKWALQTIQDSTFKHEFRGDDYLADKIKEKRTWREDLKKLAEERGLSYEEMLDIYLHDRNFSFD